MIQDDADPLIYRGLLVLSLFVLLVSAPFASMLDPGGGGPKPISTPTPTLSPAVEITAQFKVGNVIRYTRIVDYLMQDYYEFDQALVMAVMAQESGGIQAAVAADGLSCGVMQVIPRPWYKYTKEEVCNSYWANIDQGMIILHYAITRAQEQGYDLRYGVAYYNCLETSVHADRCGKYGGLHYADKVLNFWLPRVIERLEEYREYLAQSVGG